MQNLKKIPQGSKSWASGPNQIQMQFQCLVMNNQFSLPGEMGDSPSSWKFVYLPSRIPHRIVILSSPKINHPY